MLRMGNIGDSAMMAAFRTMKDILLRKIGCREYLLWISSGEVGPVYNQSVEYPVRRLEFNWSCYV
jgi:hypothetical protein